MRDLLILLALYCYRALTSRQIARLFFNPEQKVAGEERISTRCRYRLQMFFHYELVERVEQPSRLSEGSKGFMYYLSSKGYELLVAQHLVEPFDWSPQAHRVSPYFQEHLLLSNDFRIGVTLAVNRLGFKLTRWLDDKCLRSPQMKDPIVITGPKGGKITAAVIPDGLFTIETYQRSFNFALELDRATVTAESSLALRRDWVKKIRTYVEYYDSGKFQQKYGHGLRVLTVTTGVKRLEHLKTVTEKSGGRNRFWFTTIYRVTKEDILTAKIWNVATREGMYALMDGAAGPSGDPRAEDGHAAKQ